jgi:hypothetical protein
MEVFGESTSSLPEKFSNIKYINIREVYTKILAAGRSCIIIKKDIKDAFRNIPISTRVSERQVGKCRLLYELNGASAADGRQSSPELLVSTQFDCYRGF